MPDPTHQIAPTAVTVRQLQGGGYMVASRTTDGAWWHVVDQTCSCPAGRMERRCRHLRAVAEYCAEQNRRMARPTAPPHTSALVD
jgi:hypothetical protein